MSALVERIIAARDSLKGLNISNYALIADARDVMADAANALVGRDVLIAQLLKHSISHYGSPADETCGVGLIHAQARAVLNRTGGA